MTLLEVRDMTLMMAQQVRDVVLGVSGFAPGRPQIEGNSCTHTLYGY